MKITGTKSYIQIEEENGNIARFDGIPYTQNEMKYLAMMDLTMGKCSYEEFITKMKNL